VKDPGACYAGGEADTWLVRGVHGGTVLAKSSSLDAIDSRVNLESTGFIFESGMSANSLETS
jgi:hypothetical protein